MSDTDRRVEGEITNVCASKGYGFATLLNGERGRIFVHVTKLPRDYLLRVGQQISFTIKQDENGRKFADHVVTLESN